MRRAAALLGLAALVGAGGCHGIVLSPIQQGTGGNGAQGTGGDSSSFLDVLSTGQVNKIDLLLAIDNSSSMADKQAVLALAVPDLLNGLLNPPCVDPTSGKVVTQSSDPTAACPVGSAREFAPVFDMHVGLVSSSLGTFGANGCPDMPPSSCPNSDTTPLDDHGHLVTRSDSCDSSGPVPTYQSLGFLAWDPKQVLSPPGTAILGAIGSCSPEPGCMPAFGSGSGLVGALHDLVVGNGQEGCGFESQNESWYRFLVDPAPYASVMPDTIPVVTSGIDATLLKQRAEFLRPDSLLAVVLLSDETDTSIKEYSSYPLFADPALHLPHATSACTTKGPLDTCCASCGQPTVQGCPADPACTSDPNYTNADENTAIRAFGLISHKQRYGIEFFYQPSRYIEALTSATVVDQNGNSVPNPIFTNLNPSVYTGAVRDPSLVIYAAIVGVPWQLIARQDLKTAQPDLLNGVSTIDASQVGGFKTGRELLLTDAAGNTFWDDIVGDPESYVLAKSPFMQESTVPRQGIDPITGVTIAPPTTQNGSGPKAGIPSEPLNDHEWIIPTPPADIEYACIFPLLSPRDESATGPFANTGDCASNPTDNPLCSPNPNDSGKSTLQTSAKAYPGLKHLAIAKGMGDQGVVGSICPAQLTDSTAADYGYRPAIAGIVNRMKQSLARSQCFPHALTPDANGQVACVVLEARNSSTCTCDGTHSREPVSATQQALVNEALATPEAKAQNLDCFCSITQASGADLQACQTEPVPNSNGWCYVDPSEGQAQAAIVAACPPGDQHSIRFSGTAAPAANTTLFISCD